MFLRGLTIVHEIHQLFNAIVINALEMSVNTTPKPLVEWIYADTVAQSLYSMEKSSNVVSTIWN